MPLVNMNNNMCRACLEVSDQVLYPLKGKISATDVEIVDMISYLTLSKVELGEYPSAVCIPCFKSIREAYNFLLQYNRCQEKLKSTFGNLKSSAEKQEIENDNEIFDNTENYFGEQVLEDTFLNTDVSICKRDIADSFIGNKNVKIKKQSKTQLYSIEYLCIKGENVDENATEKIEIFNVTLTDSTNETQKSTKNMKYYVDNSVCPVCKQEVNDFHELIQHLSQSHKDNMYCCTLCRRRRKYTSQQYLQHISRNHVFYCTFCKKIFTSYATLYYHLKVKHAKNKNIYKCDQCDKTYPIKSLLTNHKKTHIVGEKYLCNQCGAAFITYKTYNHHKKKHDGTWNIKKYKCEVCQQTFALKFSLRRHMFKHSKEDNFLCNKCGKGFRTYDTYNYHKKTHDNTRNHICSVCGQAFLQAVHLKDHMERHSRIKNYRCEICEKEYSGTGSLRKHRRIYHANIKIESNSTLNKEHS